MDKPRAQTSMRLLHIAYHDFEGIADNVDERERLVRDLSDHEAMILRNHGLRRSTFCSWLERACQVQVMALSCNTKLIEDTYERMQPMPGRVAHNGDLAWPAPLRKLDRADPSYRD
jgi:ribulose-5-phosphate 4-epimerase/fuculose-1-phosphate aldolase